MAQLKLLLSDFLSIKNQNDVIPSSIFKNYLRVRYVNFKLNNKRLIIKTFPKSSMISNSIKLLRNMEMIRMIFSIRNYWFTGYCAKMNARIKKKLNKFRFVFKMFNLKKISSTRYFGSKKMKENQEQEVIDIFLI